jgi:deoxyribodipyrimidine photolyase-related protein
MQTVLVFGDQCHRGLSSLVGCTPADTRVLMVTNIGYLASKRWHRQRLHVVLASMRRFAIDLRAEGFFVDEQVAPTMADGLASHRATYAPTSVRAMVPMSFRGRSFVAKHCDDVVPNGQFLCSYEDFAAWTKTRKGRLKMEDFYRWQRSRLDVLVEPDGSPTGGRWNYDDENREPIPKGGGTWPEPETFEIDDVDAYVSALIDEHAPQAFGAPWSGLWPTSTEQAQRRLRRVIEEVLPHFGPHEDAMTSTNWHLAHTLLSSSLNLGLITPAECVDAAVDAYRSGSVPIASAEGFIRQVIGWREYVWGLYWLWMPDFADWNSLGATRPVPPSFQGETTKMRCVSQCVSELDERGYNHHIQRLMVLGNYALLTGVSPQAMTEWMWASFVDAAEWVMVPNVVGMSQHADEGRMATKPYVAGGAYISKMSDYCKGCAYDPKKRTGDDACPFTTLYWDFLARHEARFRKNNRMAQQYAGMRRLSDLPQVRERASEFMTG